MVVHAVRQGGRAGGFRLDEGRTAGVNVSVFVGHSAEKPEVDGRYKQREREKERGSDAETKRGGDQENVEPCSERQG